MAIQKKNDALGHANITNASLQLEIAHLRSRLQAWEEWWQHNPTELVLTQLCNVAPHDHTCFDIDSAQEDDHTDVTHIIDHNANETAEIACQTDVVDDITVNDFVHDAAQGHDEAGQTESHGEDRKRYVHFNDEPTSIHDSNAEVPDCNNEPPQSDDDAIAEDVSRVANTEVAEDVSRAVACQSGTCFAEAGCGDDDITVPLLTQLEAREVLDNCKFFKACHDEQLERNNSLIQQNLSLARMINDLRIVEDARNSSRPAS